MNAPPPQSARYAPSVVELVLALIILGIIAAMSMPASSARRANPHAT